MRCYCCDAQDPAIDDTPTGRWYCGACWMVIEELIAQEREEEDEDLLDMEEDDEQFEYCSEYTWEMPAVWA